jgi:hypothetical protein
MKKDFSLGLVLTALGLIILLLNIKFIAINWIAFVLTITFVLSVVLIVLYYNNNNSLFLISGLILLTLSIVSLLDQFVFTNIRITSFIYIYAAGIYGIISYLKNKNNIFLILGTILLAIGSHNLLQQLTLINIAWFRLILISLAFYISYLLGYKKNGIIWPKYISIIFLILGSIALLYYKGLFNLGLGNLLSYIISILIIIMGFNFFYITLKERR